jgi:hypothetical protein
MIGKSTVIMGTSDFFFMVARLLLPFLKHPRLCKQHQSPMTTKNQQTLEMSENSTAEEQEVEVARKPAQQNILEEKRCYERDY